jgi:hypothetical protein
MASRVQLHDCTCELFMAFEIDRLTTASLFAAPTPIAAAQSEEAAAADPSLPDFRTVLKEQISPFSAGPPAAAAPVVSAPVVAAPVSPLATLAGLPNGGLMVNPTGNNALSGGTIPYNPSYYATPEAAVWLAQQTGGSVADMRGQISNNQAEYYINLPNGTSINAGNLVAICNNPVYQGNPGIMDHMIAELLNNNAVGTPGVGTGQYTVKNGHITYDPYTQCTAPEPYRT